MCFFQKINLFPRKCFYVNRIIFCILNIGLGQFFEQNLFILTFEHIASFLLSIHFLKITHRSEKEQHSFYNYGRGTALYFLKQPFLDNFPLLFILFPEDSCLHDHKIITAATVCELLGLIIFWLDSLQCRCVPLLIIETILVHMKFIKHLKTRKWFISSNKNKNKSKLHSYINVVYTDILEVT